jgi:hypothetical protein
VKVAIHQPNYLPYIGFFQKMSMADIFVILDNVQFSKGSFTQRTKIRTKEGWMWLTIPVEKKYVFNTIKDVSLPEDPTWVSEHQKSIKFHYSSCKYADGKFIEEYWSEPTSNKRLQEFNERGILYLKNEFGIETDIIRATELDPDSNLSSTDLLIDIVEKVGGSSYISGTGGRNYLDPNKFVEHNINLSFFEFTPFKYSQRWEGFEPYLSAIDLLFNLGPESSEFITLK